MLRRLFRKPQATSKLGGAQELIAFLPILESGKLQRAVRYFRKHQKDKPEIGQLRELLGNNALIGGSDWTRMSPLMLTILVRQETKLVQQLSTQDIKTLLTIFSRHDRLADGVLLSSVCQSGLMTAALQRLKALHETGEIA